MDTETTKEKFSLKSINILLWIIFIPTLLGVLGYQQHQAHKGQSESDSLQIVKTKLQIELTKLEIQKLKLK